MKNQTFKQTIEEAIKTDQAYSEASSVVADYCARPTNLM